MKLRLHNHPCRSGITELVVAGAVSMFVWGGAVAGPTKASAPLPDSARQNLPTVFEATATAAGDPDNPLNTLSETLIDVFGVDTLQTLFDGEAHHTVFAPTNTAFDDLFAAIDGDTCKTEVVTTNLSDVLLYHVTKGDWYSVSFPVGNLTMMNPDGDAASVIWEGEDAQIEGAVISDQIIVKNGIIQQLGAVIVPPQVKSELAACDES
jgi:uncharacterized surface protein with fasciclin (FAS1) repeats